jgi:xylulokinase
VPLYLGFDSSTQSLTAIVIEVGDRVRRVVFESSLAFDETLPHYGTRHGVLPQSDPRVATSSPLMWAEALDLMMRRLAESGIDLGQIAAVSGSAQQHGSVYLNAQAARTFGTLDPSRPIVDQIRGVFSRDESPIWTRARLTSVTTSRPPSAAMRRWRAGRGLVRSSALLARRSESSSRVRLGRTRRRIAFIWSARF